MGNGSLSSSNNQNRADSQRTLNDSDQLLILDLQYTDQTRSVLLENRIRFRPTETIRSVINDIVVLDELDGISWEEIGLVCISFGGQITNVSESNIRKTLQELQIKTGSLLCFESLKIKKRRKSWQLILFSPNDNSKKIYEWNEKSTTLEMLLNSVIDIFALNSTKPENIQLCTFLNENLNCSINLPKKLSQLGLNNYSSIFITISKLNPFRNYHSDILVRVNNSLHGEILLYGSRTDSIIELKQIIQRRFPNCYHLHIEFDDTRREDLTKNDPKRILKTLGIKPDEIINMNVKESISTKQTTTTNKNDNTLESAISTVKQCPVFVQCTLSTKESITIEVLATDTLATVTSKIRTVAKIQPTTQFRLYTESVNIDNKQPDRRLSDFGVKSGSTIYAHVIKMHPVIYSMTSNQIDLSSKILNRFENELKPRGLVNLGNTCFMNSALQCLIHIAPLTRFFLEGFTQTLKSDSHEDKFNPFDTCGIMTAAYAELVWNMRKFDCKDSDFSYAFKPAGIKEAIGYYAPRFASSDQQDAQEFLSFLLNAIHDELKEQTKYNQNTIIQQLFYGTILSKVTCLKCNRVKTTENRTSFLPLPIHHQEQTFFINFVTKTGDHNSTVINIYANGKVKHLVQRFLDYQSLSHLFNRILVIGTNLDGPIEFETSLKQISEKELTFIEHDYNTHSIQPDHSEQDLDKLTLEECLQGFVSLEHLDDHWFCQEKTCKNTSATKQLQFSSLPYIIIIQIKRFSFENGLRQKLETFIDYPLNELDLSTILSVSSLKKENTVYDLIAVCNHIGSIHSGHYTAYARQTPNEDDWYEFDDNYVSKINSKKNIISKNAYLLFYIKRTK